MFRHQHYVPLLLFVLVFGVNLQAQEPEEGNCTNQDIATRPDCHRAIAFLHELQEAIRTNQPRKVASLVHFPLHGTARKSARTKADFIRNYGKIFNAGVRCVVLRAQDSEVWGNYSGFMIGSGMVWWDAIVPPDADFNSADFWTKYPFRVVSVCNTCVLPKNCEVNSTKPLK